MPCTARDIPGIKTLRKMRVVLTLPHNENVLEMSGHSYHAYAA